MLFKKEKNVSNIINEDISAFHNFINDNVDVFNKAVTKFIYDSVDHIEAIDDKILKEKFLTFIKSIQKYEHSRKELDIMMQHYTFKIICNRVKADICD